MFNPTFVANRKLNRRALNLDYFKTLGKDRDWLWDLLVNNQSYLTLNKSRICPKTPRVYSNIK